MIRRARPWLGTIVEIACDDLPAIEAGFAAIAHAHARMSFHEATSDLAALRDATPGSVVAVDAQTVQVLRSARELYRATDGLFDVTIGRQLVATKFLPRVTAPPLTHYNGNANDIAAWVRAIAAKPASTAIRLSPAISTIVPSQGRARRITG